MADFASASSGAGAGAAAAAEGGDWRAQCVAPPKDTRVQTAVSWMGRECDFKKGSMLVFSIQGMQMLE